MQGDDNLLDELLTTGLKRSSTVKDLRRHTRIQTKMEETGSIDSGKSKDGPTAKFKNALSELDMLRKQNEALEMKIKELEINESNPEVARNKIWTEVQVLLDIDIRIWPRQYFKS